MKPPKFPPKSPKAPTPKGKKGGLGMMPMDLKNPMKGKGMQKPGKKGF